GRLKAPQGCAGLGPELAVDLAEVVAEPAQAPLHAAELVVRIEVAERELVLLLLLALALARDHSQDRRGRADRQRLIDEPVTVGLALELAALIVLEPVSFTGPRLAVTSQPHAQPQRPDAELEGLDRVGLDRLVLLLDLRHEQLVAGQQRVGIDPALP